MQENELIPHLFRTEYRKLVAVLCKVFGMEHIEVAEDIASETFLLAAETWGMKGLPKNPTAWLYTVAKNKAKDVYRRGAVFNRKVAVDVKRESETTTEIEIDLSNENIIDSQLQMMFAVCHPAIAPDAQVGLSLNILCGFGAEEIADAFLTNRETMYKRLARAKEKLRTEKVPIEFPPPHEIETRLSAVLTTLYLLFSEGYHSSSQDTTMRKELCLEAMRLTLMLAENESTNTPQTNALLALMCFHASRFDARTNQQGEIVLYEEQDERLWNQELIDRGTVYLNRASQGPKLSKYHCEAAIAYWHTHKKDSPEKWESILQLYNRLLIIEYSPIAALNRTYALSKAHSKEEAITEAEKLQLSDNPLYFTMLGHLYSGIDNQRAINHFQSALIFTKTASGRSTIGKHIQALQEDISRIE